MTRLFLISVFLLGCAGVLLSQEAPVDSSTAPAAPPAPAAQTTDSPQQSAPGQPAQSVQPRESSEDSQQKPAPAADDPLSIINILGETQIEAATNALREGFVQPSALGERELRRAQFAGLLQRLGTGVELGLDSEKKSAAATPFLGEIIDGRIGYLRPQAINAGDLAQLDALLADFSQKNIQAVILDLRGVEFGSDFEAAAEMARRFTPKGTLLFRLDRPGAKQERLFTANQDPVFQGILVVLTGPRTAGAAEVVAGVLRISANAILLGDTTAGTPVEYQVLQLGGGVVMRFAVAEAVLGNDQRFFQKGLAVDLRVESDPVQEQEIFRLSAERGVSDFVFEKERPRMNEAALIANANPEIESSSSPQTAPLLDKPLQRAVDIVTAMQLFQP